MLGVLFVGVRFPRTPTRETTPDRFNKCPRRTAPCRTIPAKLLAFHDTRSTRNCPRNQTNPFNFGDLFFLLVLNRPKNGPLVWVQQACVSSRAAEERILTTNFPFGTVQIFPCGSRRTRVEDLGRIMNENFTRAWPGCQPSSPAGMEGAWWSINYTPRSLRLSVSDQ